MEKMIYESKDDRFNDPKDINKSIEELEKNSNEIKNTFKKYDSRNDSRVIIKRIRDRSESPIENNKRICSNSNENR